MTEQLNFRVLLPHQIGKGQVSFEDMPSAMGDQVKIRIALGDGSGLDTTIYKSDLIRAIAMIQTAWPEDTPND